MGNCEVICTFSWALSPTWRQIQVTSMINSARKRGTLKCNSSGVALTINTINVDYAQPYYVLIAFEGIPRPKCSSFRQFAQSTTSFWIWGNAFIRLLPLLLLVFFPSFRPFSIPGVIESQPTLFFFSSIEY